MLVELIIACVTIALCWWMHLEARKHEGQTARTVQAMLEADSKHDREVSADLESHAGAIKAQEARLVRVEQAITKSEMRR